MPTLREARLAAGLSVRGLAERAGVSESTVVRIERHRTRPRPGIVRRLAAALGLPPEEVAEFRPMAQALSLPPPTLRAR